MQDNPDRAIRRLRHEIKRRQLEVVRAIDLTPRMRRITLGGAELEGFESPGFDDHIKLFFPVAGATDDKAPMRDYTPYFDAASGHLHIDFAVHAAGPATDWALRAQPGDRLAIAGPRGSAIIPTHFDWHLLIGDETALPAIGRRLRELAAGAVAIVICEVEDEAERQTFESAAQVRVEWVYRHGTAAGQSAALAARLREIEFPPGDFFAWAAAESNVARALRQVLVAERAAVKSWVKAAGYWKHGNSASHEAIED